jgi:RNA polymerase sigma-70 factor (ECF subfamily)
MTSDWPRGPEDRLAAAQQGDEAAWRSLYLELAPAVHGYLRTRGAADPEDLTGEVFLQAAQKIGGFSGSPANFRSWIFTIAHHRLVDAHRRHARRPLHLVDELPEEAGASTTDGDALEALASQRVEGLVRTLTDDQRDVLLLRLLAGLTIEEIAAILGRSVGSTKQLQRRGLQNLRKAIESDSDGGIPS